MSKVRIFALGGLDEDGKNMYVVENNDDIFVLECGLKYPDGEQYGVQMIIPDFTYLKENKDRIRGVFITHGHDDVMAALPSLLKEIPDVPVYTAPLTAAMFERKAKKAGIKHVNIHRIRRNARFKIGDTKIRTFGTTQSIADGFGVAIETADGYVVYSSEFIVDYDTKNEAFDFDLTNITDLANEGVLLLMAESVGCTRAGHSSPYHRITPQIEHFFEDSSRMFITLFNQNIYRVIEVIELANKYNRRVFIYDEELRQLMKDMASLGYYRIPAGLEVPPDDFSNDMENVLVIIAGNGANIFKKVHKIANKEDENVEFRNTDTVIIASPAVPGTEREEAGMEDDLYREAGRVAAVDAKRAFTMHASREDLKMMMYLMKPKYYMPVKGEYRQLIANANIALDMGFRADYIIVMDNGQVAQIDDGKLQRNFNRIDHAEDVLVDGDENLDASGMVLKDRETLSTDGAIIVGVVVNHKTKEIIGGPDVQSRGVIYLKDADYIIQEIGNIMEKTINEAVKNNTYDNLECRADARDRIARYVIRETGKRPMILPAIVEINTKDE